MRRSLTEHTDAYILKYNDDKAKVELLKKKFESANNYRTEFEERWDRNNRMYKKYIDKNKYMFTSKIFVPLTQQAIITLIQNTIPGLFENKKFFEIINFEELSSDITDFIENLLLNELYINNNFIEVFTHNFLSLLIKGLAITKNIPVRKKITNRKFKSTNTFNLAELPVIKNIYEVARRLNIVRDNSVEIEIRTQFSNIDIDNFWIQPYALRIDKADYVIERTFYTLDDFLVKFNEPDNDTKLNSMFNSKSIDESNDDVNRKRNTSELIEVFEYYINTTDEKYLFYLLNNEKILKVRDNEIDGFKNKNLYDLLPYQDFHFLVDDSTFYSEGLIDLIRHTQLEINDARNMRRDNQLKRLFPSYLYDPKILGVNSVQLNQGLSKAGKSLGIPITGMINQNIQQSLYLLPTNVLTGELYREEEMLQMEHETTTGTTGYTKGNSGMNYNKTARGVIAIQQAAMKRLDFLLFMLQEFYLKDLLNTTFSQIQNFYNAKHIFKIASNNNYTKIPITDELLNKIRNVKVGFYVEFTSVHKEKTLENLFRAFSVIVNIPGANPMPVASEVLENLNIKDIDKILPNPDIDKMVMDYENTISAHNLKYKLQMPIPGPKINHNDDLHLVEHSQYQQDPEMAKHIMLHIQQKQHKEMLKQSQMINQNGLQQQGMPAAESGDGQLMPTEQTQTQQNDVSQLPDFNETAQIARGGQNV